MFETFTFWVSRESNRIVDQWSPILINSLCVLLIVADKINTNW